MNRALAALVLACVCTAPLLARADDVGSRDDVRVVRHDAALLAARRVRAAGVDPSNIVVDGVVAERGYAFAQWHAGTLRSIDGFKRIYKRWWNVPATSFPPDVIHDAAAHLSPASGGMWNAPPQSHALAPLLFSQRDTVEPSAQTDGFGMVLSWATNDAPSDAQLTRVIVRAPTEAESWLAYPGGNSYCFFSANVQSAHAISVNAGSTLDVWFPFVLEPQLRYSLTIAHVNPAIGPIDATLADNVLHFALPRFTVQQDVQLMGEIEGDIR